MKVKLGTIDSTKAYVIVYWTGTFEYHLGEGDKEVRNYIEVFELPNGVNLDRYIEDQLRQKEASILTRPDWTDIKITGCQIIESADEFEIKLK